MSLPFMAIKLHHHRFVSSSSSNSCLSLQPRTINLSCKKLADLDKLLGIWGNSRRRCFIGLAVLDNGNHSLNCHFLGFKKNAFSLRKSRRTVYVLPSATSDDGVAINGSAKSDVEEMRAKLSQSLQTEDYSNGLVQSLHDSARTFELNIKQKSFPKIPWFSTAWLGIDQNAWVKTLSYQASVYCLLQATSEIASRGNGRDQDTNVFVQRSVSRQSTLLENVIREKLSAKQPEIYEWFWSEQVPMVVTTFVNYFEGDSRFSAATAYGKGMSPGPGNASDISLLMLALTCSAAIIKLGPTKVSCVQFSSINPDVTGRLMDMLVDFIPLSQAYHSVKDMGLRREFLLHFGPRAAACRVNTDRGAEETVFWVDLIQSQLQRAIDRERIWSKLTTSESIEVLERDLAIFGVFIALGRSTQSFLSANGFSVLSDPIEDFIRYLIGGSVLYYPQLSSINSYQFYVEVVCEELDWLPFYPGDVSTPKQVHGHGSKHEGPPNAEALPVVLDVCSHWMQSFIKYSKWLESPSNVKAAKFLSKGHKKLIVCTEEVEMFKNEIARIDIKSTEAVSESFDKALESVDEALVRLEELLQNLHVSSSSSGKEHLKVACSDLEKIRTLKKEAEFLEASFRAKSGSLQQEDNVDQSKSSAIEQQQYFTGKNKKSDNLKPGNSSRNPRGPWSFFVRPPIIERQPDLSVVDGSEDKSVKQPTAKKVVSDSVSTDVKRFELLRNELIELEERVQRSTDQSENEEDIKLTNDGATFVNNVGGAQLVQVQKKENLIEKSFGKLKEAGTDVWQGTQLLAIDVAAAAELLRRVVVGDELTEKEQKSLRRTMTDVASVVPIGVLMLLPVTAVGHAAILAGIQRYVPSLIPSTYGSERLDLFRKLEKLKEIESSEAKPDEGVEN